MRRDIADKIVEELVGRLPDAVPNKIYIFGGNDEIREYVINKIGLRVSSSIINDFSTKGEYVIDLGYFIKKYSGP